MDGQRIGDYVVEAKLGGGGMATVYRVRHHLLDTKHALKVLDDRFRAMAEARQRFLDEARIQAQHLDHPNIVKVTNIVATEAAAALVMDLVDGPTLGEHIASLRRPPTAAGFRGIALPILAAVQHAHDHGIIHRDLKPDNVLLGERDGVLVPYVTDFGVAKVGDAAARALGKKGGTELEVAMGTAGYKSPEQIRHAARVTERSDVFSVGALLYELATLRAAFDAPNDFDLESKIVNGELTPVRDVAPGVEPAIAAAIERALRPDPAERFATCAELAEAIGAGGAADARPPAHRSRARQAGSSSRNTNPAVWVMALGAFVVVGAGVYLLASRSPNGGAPTAGRPQPVVYTPPGPDAAWSLARDDIRFDMERWFWPQVLASYEQIPAGDPEEAVVRPLRDQAEQRLIEEHRTHLQAMFARGECKESGIYADAVAAELPQLRDEMFGVTIECMGMKPTDRPVLPYVTYFTQNDDTLDSRHGAWLARVADIIGARAGHVDIIGYADTSEFASADLAARRAEAVRAYLIDRGVSPDRLGAMGGGVGTWPQGPWRNRSVVMRPSP